MYGLVMGKGRPELQKRVNEESLNVYCSRVSGAQQRDKTICLGHD